MAAFLAMVLADETNHLCRKGVKTAVKAGPGLTILVPNYSNVESEPLCSGLFKKELRINNFNCHDIILHEFQNI